MLISALNEHLHRKRKRRFLLEDCFHKTSQDHIDLKNSFPVVDVVESVPLYKVANSGLNMSEIDASLEKPCSSKM